MISQYNNLRGARPVRLSLGMPNTKHRPQHNIPMSPACSLALWCTKYDPLLRVPMLVLIAVTDGSGAEDTLPSRPACMHRASKLRAPRTPAPSSAGMNMYLQSRTPKPTSCNPLEPHYLQLHNRWPSASIPAPCASTATNKQKWVAFSSTMLVGPGRSFPVKPTHRLGHQARSHGIVKKGGWGGW